MEFYKIFTKYGLKTALSDLKLRIKNFWKKGLLTWRNPRLWKQWKRNTDIWGLASFVIVLIILLTIILFIPIFVEITNYQQHYFQCPRIIRLI